MTNYVIHVSERSMGFRFPNLILDLKFIAITVTFPLDSWQRKKYFVLKFEYFFPPNWFELGELHKKLQAAVKDN